MGLFDKKKKKIDQNYQKESNELSYEELYGGEIDEAYDLDVMSYEEVYDEDGNYAFVQCDCCREYIKWKDDNYVCPNCGFIMSRVEFFNAIGAEPPGPECITCNNLYPGCIICPFGYVDDDDE